MRYWNRTKIVATIGPSSSSHSIIEKLISKGMDIARINLSHGKEEEQRRMVNSLRRVSYREKSSLAILIDIPGPKIRLGPLDKKVVFLKKGSKFTLTGEKIIGNEERASINYPQVLEKIKKGSLIYFNDGLIKLRVVKAKDDEVICLTENSGEIMSGKGVNIPGISFDDCLGEKETEEKVKFACELEPDFLAISFVKDKSDLIKVKKIIGKKEIFIIAKIEKKEAIKNIDSIIEESDGIMVARGDLGIETSLEKLPLLQKEIIEKCNLKGKPVIVATQILSSMVSNPIPTRAEVTDIANAILDGADCLMLSEETAIGKYPVEAISTLYKVSLFTEKNFPYRKYLTQRIEKDISILEAISYSAVWSSYKLEAKAVIVPTYSGETARWVSKFRPKATIFALTSEKKILRRLNIFWGVYPIFFPLKISLERLPRQIDTLFKRYRFLKKGTRVIITGSNPMGEEGKTNLIQIHQIR